MTRYGSGEQSVNNDLLMFQQEDNALIKCYKQTIPVNIYHFYINEQIDDYKPYQDLINILKTAEEHDRIIIYLNCPGGDLYVSIQIINAIRASRATVVTCIDGQACSAATLIFLSGHEYMVNKHCSFMIHSYSEGIFGKGNEIISRVTHTSTWFKKLAYEIYGGFLSDVEIKDMLEGKDIWMDSEGVIERLKKTNQPIIDLEQEQSIPEPDLIEEPPKPKKTKSKIKKS